MMTIFQFLFYILYHFFPRQWWSRSLLKTDSSRRSSLIWKECIILNIGSMASKNCSKKLSFGHSVFSYPINQSTNLVASSSLMDFPPTHPPHQPTLTKIIQNQAAICILPFLNGLSFSTFGFKPCTMSKAEYILKTLKKTNILKFLSWRFFQSVKFLCARGDSVPTYAKYNMIPGIF